MHNESDNPRQTPVATPEGGEGPRRRGVRREAEPEGGAPRQASAGFSTLCDLRAFRLILAVYVRDRLYTVDSTATRAPTPGPTRDGTITM